MENVELQRTCSGCADDSTEHGGKRHQPLVAVNALIGGIGNEEHSERNRDRTDEEQRRKEIEVIRPNHDAHHDGIGNNADDEGHQPPPDASAARRFRGATYTARIWASGIRTGGRKAHKYLSKNRLFLAMDHIWLSSYYGKFPARWITMSPLSYPSR